MKLSVLVEGLRSDLGTLAALAGDEATAGAGRRLVAALDSAVGLRTLDLLGQVAVELSGQLPSGRVEVRLAGQDPELVYVDDEPVPEDQGELSARLTLRLPERLKAQVDLAANREGLSVNTWLVRVLTRATTTERRPGGRRLSGYGRT